MKKFLILILSCLSLQSCFFAGAAAGATAIGIVYDHRSFNSILLDQRIARQIGFKIKDNPPLHEGTHVNVTSFGQMVLLTGEANSAELRHSIEEAARSTPGVRRVYNAIRVQGPTSTLTHASDSWITTKIKTQLIAQQGFQSASIKVVTENGTVYLMGSLTQVQAEKAVDLARHTSGVQRVIKIMEYRD